MNQPMFDIFKGTGEKDAAWQAAASSLWEARQRMNELAAKSPGQYFVFSQESQFSRRASRHSKDRFAAVRRAIRERLTFADRQSAPTHGACAPP